MPRTCTVCVHPKRGAIDRDIIAGGSFRAIAGRFGLSKSAVERHGSDHLPVTMVKAHEAEDVRHALDVVGQLKQINTVCLAVLTDAHTARNGDLALKAVDRIQRQIELQAKLIGELDERPVMNVLVTNPEWLSIRAAILDALRAHPEARQDVLTALATVDTGSVHATH